MTCLDHVVEKDYTRHLIMMQWMRGSENLSDKNVERESVRTVHLFAPIVSVRWHCIMVVACAMIYTDLDVGRGRAR